MEFSREGSFHRFHSFRTDGGLRLDRVTPVIRFSPAITVCSLPGCVNHSTGIKY